MKPTINYIFLVITLLLISYVAAYNDVQDEMNAEIATNQVTNEGLRPAGGEGGYGYGWGGRGGGGGYGGWGGYGGGGGWGGGGGGWGGRGGGRCRYGCCGGGWGGGGYGGYGGGWGGGCRCCHSAQEALAYMQSEVRP